MEKSNLSLILVAIVVLAAIAGIVYIERCALEHGIDGVAVGSAVVILAAIAAGYAGFRIRDIIKK